MLAKSQVSLATMATVLGSLAVALVLGLALVALRSALLWIVVAFFVCLILHPLVDALSAKLPRAMAVAAITLAGLALTTGVALLVLPPFGEQVRALLASAPELADRLGQSPGFRRLDARFDLSGSLTEAARALPDRLAGAASPLLQLLRGLFRFGLATVSIFFLVVFMLHGGRDALRKAAGLLGPRTRPRVERLSLAIYLSISRYALATGGVALVAGAMAAATLAAAGVPYFLPLGLLVMVLDLVPFVGAVSAGVLLTLVTWANVGWVRALVVLGVFVVYQQLEGHLVLPLVHRRTVRVSALGLVIALLIGLELAGLVGLLFAVPVAGALKIAALELIGAWREQGAGPARTGAPAATSVPDPEEPDRLRPH